MAKKNLNHFYFTLLFNIGVYMFWLRGTDQRTENSDELSCISTTTMASCCEGVGG